MSGFELKEVGENERDPTPTRPISNIPNTMPRDESACEAAELLSGTFEFLTLLSEGIDVTSYLVRDLRPEADDGLVVLRVLDRACDPGRRELFELEARAAAKLTHRNIIRSYPCEEINGVHFSINERRADTETLKNLLERHGWMDLRLAIGILHQISDALEYAHALGVLHLRIHPENILIDQDDTALLADFGLEARRDLAWAHEERSTRCPIRYVSPEQASGKTVDARSDVYSLGVVLYQMLTDRLPVDSQDLEEVRQKQLTQTPLPPHLYFTDIPVALSEVITSMLEKEPAKRFTDVASFRAALDKSLGQQAGQFVQRWNPTPRLEENEKNEEPGWEDEIASIDLAALDRAKSRERWECPSITVIEPPVTEIASESHFEQHEALAEAPPEPSPSRRLVDAFSGKELYEQAASSTQWRPMILILALAIAAIVLIGLALADRARISNRLLESTAKKDNQTSIGLASAPSGLPTEDKTPVANQPPPAADLQTPGNSSSSRSGPLADGAATSASPLRNTQKRITRPSSQRLRQARLKWRRPRRYRGNYRSAGQRYYRSGER
jgi:serine/threonine protein kinase